MGVFSKLKNIFYDEEVIEEPSTEIKIDKPAKKEIVEKPRVEEIKVVRQEERREREQARFVLLRNLQPLRAQQAG